MWPAFIGTYWSMMHYFPSREVVMLKILWDMTELVKSSFNDWNTTLWQDINVEQMELDCKTFVKVKHLLFLSEHAS